MTWNWVTLISSKACFAMTTCRVPSIFLLRYPSPSGHASLKLAPYFHSISIYCQRLINQWILFRNKTDLIDSFPFIPIKASSLSFVLRVSPSSPWLLHSVRQITSFYRPVCISNHFLYWGHRLQGQFNVSTKGEPDEKSVHCSKQTKTKTITKRGYQILQLPSGN